MSSLARRSLTSPGRAEHSAKTPRERDNRRSRDGTGWYSIDALTWAFAL
jgi:hypothetical protein